MKLSAVKFMQAVRVDGAMADSAPSATVFDAGVLVPSSNGAVLVPWHMVRYADVEVELVAAEASIEAPRAAAASLVSAEKLRKPRKGAT